MGAAQVLLQLMESSTDDKTSCSFVQTTPLPPRGWEVNIQSVILFGKHCVCASKYKTFTVCYKAVAVKMSDIGYVSESCPQTKDWVMQWCCQPRSGSGGLDEAAETMCLSGLLLTSLWDRRSGTRGLGGPDGLRSSGSLQEKHRLNNKFYGGIQL